MDLRAVTKFGLTCPLRLAPAGADSLPNTFLRTTNSLHLIKTLIRKVGYTDLDVLVNTELNREVSLVDYGCR